MLKHTPTNMAEDTDSAARLESEVLIILYFNHEQQQMPIRVIRVGEQEVLLWGDYAFEGEVPPVPQ